MMVEIDPGALDGLVREWLKETLLVLGHNAAGYLHPEDGKQNRKDIKAVKRLLDYVGPGA
jgi:hypothetical protein